jgi:hypothetical protein
MANQGNNPNKGNQKGGQQSGKQNEQDGKADDKDREDAAPNSANPPGDKGQAGKFDSGKQTHR